LSRWENAPSARELVRLNDRLREQFIALCGEQVRQHGEILLDLDSTDDPTHGQQQLSFFNGAYNQHMYHPMLVFERHTGCLLAARLRPGNASSHARIVPILLRLVPRLQSAFPGVPIKLRGDAGFALPLLYQFCEFFGLQYAFGIPANCVFQQRAQTRQKQLKRRYHRTQLPQRSFSSFRHRARSWSRQRRICYKAEHTAVATNLRFVITNCPGRAAEVFAFYNDRGECENRIEEFKNGFRADRLSCHRLLANAFRLLLHGFAYNLVNLFRLQLPQPWRSAQIETLRAQLFKIGVRARQIARHVRFHLASGWPFQNLFRSVTCAEPVPNATILLFGSDASAGFARNFLVAQVSSDDRGYYRFAHLESGRYFVVVSAQPWFGSLAQAQRQIGADLSPEEKALLDVVYPTTSYPGVTDPASASSIAVKEGEGFTADLSLAAVPAWGSAFATSIP